MVIVLNVIIVLDEIRFGLNHRHLIKIRLRTLYGERATSWPNVVVANFFVNVLREKAIYTIHIEAWQMSCLSKFSPT